MASKANTLAMERMRERDAQHQILAMNTAQKRGTPIRDVGLQSRVLNWMLAVIDERPRGRCDYDNWIRDGIVLVKVLQQVVFNSVPHDWIWPIANYNSDEERIKELLFYLHKFGVEKDFLFEPRDLLEAKNVPKVTRCMARLGQVANYQEFANVNLYSSDEGEFGQAQIGDECNKDASEDKGLNKITMEGNSVI